MNRSLQRLEQGKLYYSISEVCRMTGLEPHVLRYWETEFAQMRPRKNSAGNRTYRAKEIQYVHYIRYLLHDEKYTIQGAKKKIAEVSPEEVAGQLNWIRPYMLTEKTTGKKTEPEKAVAESTQTATPPAPNSILIDSESSQPWRAELEKIRNELEEVLGLLRRGK